MIRLRHKLLIHIFRLLDQIMLVATGLGIIYIRPDAIVQGDYHISGAAIHFVDAIGMLILMMGWVGIFDYYIRYKSDRLVALNTQLKNLLKATTASSFWLMVVSA
ncbi:MAG: hypothetical protein EOP85_06150, partial [Verrucomicrobiaceae bacterium]